MVCPHWTITISFPNQSKSAHIKLKPTQLQVKTAQITPKSKPTNQNLPKLNCHLLKLYQTKWLFQNQTKLTVACPNELNAYPTKSKPEEKKIPSPISIDTCPNYRKQILPILFIKSQPKLNQNQWYIFYNTWHKNICNRNTS